ncbi:hypothetical protein [Erwinia sp. V71]|uniref:hypothetical protein n=1 Tax=Erwinia sp. V71 TaxID=3369424 RepID=UPI003F648CC6
MKRIRGLSLVILLVVMSVSGCSTWNSVQLRKQNINSGYIAYQLAPPLYTGDKIKYRLKSGGEGEMTVAKVGPDSLQGEKGQTIALSDIASLERKNFAKGKTAAVVGGGAVTTAVIISVIMVAGLAAAVTAL